MDRGEGIRSTGTHVPLMSGLWHGACPKNCIVRGTCNSPYAKLEALLPILKAERPSQWWHLTQRYIACEDKVIEVGTIKTLKGREPKLPPYTKARGAPALKAGFPTARIAVRQWKPEVRLEKVRRAVEWLAGELDRQGGVWL